MKNLTRREKEIVVLLSENFNSKMIAHNLGISKHCVKAHILRISKKIKLPIDDLK